MPIISNTSPILNLALIDLEEKAGFYIDQQLMQEILKSI